YRIAPELRSVGEFLTHISNATTLQERIHGTERRTTLEGFDFLAFMMQALAKEKQPRSKAATIQMLRADGDRFAAWLEGLTEETVVRQPLRLAIRKSKMVSCQFVLTSQRGSEHTGIVRVKHDRNT